MAVRGPGRCVHLGRRRSRSARGAVPCQPPPGCTAAPNSAPGPAPGRCATASWPSASCTTWLCSGRSATPLNLQVRGWGGQARCRSRQARAWRAGLPCMSRHALQAPGRGLLPLPFPPGLPADVVGITSYLDFGGCRRPRWPACLRCLACLSRPCAPLPRPTACVSWLMQSASRCVELPTPPATLHTGIPAQPARAARRLPHCDGGPACPHRCRLPHGVRPAGRGGQPDAAGSLLAGGLGVEGGTMEVGAEPVFAASSTRLSCAHPPVLRPRHTRPSPPPTPPGTLSLQQANKNVMLKAQVSLAGASVAGVFKSWWQPAFTLAGAAGVDFATGRTRLGVTAMVESWRNAR